MLSPSPLSLLCALFLCLPLAVVFTITPTPASFTAFISSSATAAAADDFLFHQETVTTTLLVSSSQASVPKINSNSTAPAPAPAPAAVADDDVSTSPTLPPQPPPPPVNYNDEEDNLLFRVASRVNPRPKNPKKLAFLFLTTTNLPFAPLWEVYFNNTPKTLYNIYIHTDPTRRGNSRRLFTGSFAHRAIPSKPTRRHTPTLISAARRLLSHALLDDPSNAMFALLSPSCIPIRSFNLTYATLAGSRKSFVEILRNEEGSQGRWAARGEDAMLPEVSLDEFRIGSQFWVLTRRHARLVVGDTRVWPKFALPCVRVDTCYPEENYFPTLLSMRDPRGVVPATLTHVDWTERYDGHPRTYMADEVGPELILGLRSASPRYGDDRLNVTEPGSGRRKDPLLFARKFEPKALKPLMSIASEVLFKD